MSKNKFIKIYANGIRDVHIVSFDSSDYKQFQKQVDGNFEFLTLPAPHTNMIVMLVVNEEDNLRDLPINAVANNWLRGVITNDYLVGDILIGASGLRDGEPDIVGLTNSKIELLLNIIFKSVDSRLPGAKVGCWNK